MENPYWLAFSSPNPAYVAEIGAWSAGFAVLFVATDRLVARSANSPGGSERLVALSSPRPVAPSTPSEGAASTGGERSGLQAATTVCSLVHAVGTTYAAARACWLLARGDPQGLAPPLWQAALAFSQGYFVADGLLYGTRREAWVLIHHSWMIIAHHPIGEPLRCCQLMGAGDCNRAIWLSATGYAAELSTIFLNIRIFQHKWLRKHSAWYSVNSALLLVTYPLTRVVAAPAIIFGSLWPHWGEYTRQGLGSLATFTTVTYTALGLMSAFYFYSLVSKGLRRALVFTPSADGDKEK